jgi:hypothetical protein
MYIVYDIRNNKVVKESENPFVTFGENYKQCYVEDLPNKTNAQYYTIANVREITKVIKEAYSQEEIIFNEETEQEETRIVEFPAITKTYLTCDILVKDRPQMSEEEKAKTLEKAKLKKYEEMVEQLIRQKYNLSQELAILRQRDSKPTEFAYYNLYAEECKAQAKAKVYGN